MKLKTILYLLLTLPFLCGCNNEDDLNAIFQSGTWHIANFFTTDNWEDTNNFNAIYKDAAEIEVLNNMEITFQADGTILGKLSNNASFSGNWSANGGNRTISINITRTTGDVNKGLNKEVYNHLREVCFYKGDSSYLQLATVGKNKYIQLGHLPF
ncbi:MAG: DUF4847 family protein [Phocaeicola sp.]